MAITIGAFSSDNGTNSGVTPAVTTQASGSTFLVFIHNIYSTLSGVSDNKGNSYLPLAPQQDWTMAGTGWTGNVRGWICENGIGGTNHIVTDAAGNADTEIAFIEVVGGLTSGILDINDYSTLGSTANPVLSASISTAQAEEMLIGFFCGDYDPTATVWNNGFTKLLDILVPGFVGASVGYRQVSSVAAYQASMSRTTANPSATMWFVSLKADSASSGNSAPFVWLTA
jgi:hypothetical protein